MTWRTGSTGWPLVAAVGIAVVACMVGVGADLALAGAGARFLAVLGFLALALAASHAVARRQTGDALNLLSLCTIFYLLAFVVGSIYVWFDPVLNLGQGVSVLPHSDLTAAVAMASVGWVLFAGGYFADPFRSIRKVARPLSGLGANVPVGTLVTALLAVGWIARILVIRAGIYFHTHTGAPTSASWFESQAALLPLVALGLVAGKAFSVDGARAAQQWRVLFVILLASELAWAIPSGTREEVVDVLAVAVIVRYYARGRLPSWSVVLALVVALVFVVFPVINAYRVTNAGSSPTAALLSASYKYEAGGLDHTFQSGGDTVARFADVTSIARILDVGRGQIAFSSLDTIDYALDDFVPRAIMPGKSDFSAFGNTFGRAYGILSPLDFNTSIAVTNVGELYLGGGWLALLLGMPILGGLLRMLDEYMRARSWDLGMAALYSVAGPLVVVGLETSIAVGFVGAFKSAVFLGLIVAGVAWCIPRVRRGHAVRAPGRASR